MVILASCQQGQRSYTWREKERGVYAHYLLEALSGKADLELYLPITAGVRLPRKPGCAQVVRG